MILQKRNAYYLNDSFIIFLLFAFIYLLIVRRYYEVFFTNLILLGEGKKKKIY